MSAHLLHLLFDLLAWATAIAVLTLTLRRAERLGLRPATLAAGRGYYLAVGLGGVAGAFLLGSANLWLSGQPGVARSVVGALTGAIVGAEGWKTRAGLAGSTGGLFAPALAAGIAVGRLGCQLAGVEDFTFGLPTALPWGLDSGDGIPRHPVALYEAVAMALTAAGLGLWLWRRPAMLMRHGFYAFCGVYAGQRFAWEFLKPYGAVAGPLNLFHLTCLCLAGYAVIMSLRAARGVPERRPARA